MKGTYRVYSGDELLAESSNVITNSGKIAIGRYLSGQLPEWASAMAIGVGETSQSVTDTGLEMEVWREEIDLKEYSISSGEVALRSIIPAPVVAKIHELGVYCTISTIRNLSTSPIALAFDTNLEDWDIVGGQSDTDNHRIGAGSIKLADTSTASAEARLNGNFASYGEDDFFYLAYQVISGGVTHITVRLKSSESDYREYNIPSPSQSGYAVERWNVGDFTVVGNPDWEDFSSVEIIALLDGELVLDGFSVKSEPQGLDTVLVSRTTLSGPDIIDKTGAQELQIEYAVDLSVGS